MNRTLYKVVFNKHRNCMTAVAENAKREGKNTADTHTAGISPNDIAGFTGFIHSISVISFSLSLLLGSALILTSPYADAQNIVADQSAPLQQQPAVMQTGNGIPQANIQTPTAAGVSVNQYTRFNVDSRGAILNNSRRNIQTQLGGWIQGNPYLAGGEARVIVNQVNSANPSLLGGYIEVGGRRAEVVIANPAGIQVNGGGFINASRATLTTGQPQYQAGDLSGFKIRQGNVVIVGHGLDARDTDYTQILSRAIKIDAPVWGKDVRVLAGQNDVSSDGSVRSSHSPAANTNSAKPLYAIDTGVLGGMYAGKITLVSTDRDASVHNRGQLFASAGHVAVNAEGKLVNTGTIAATGENHAVSLHARNVHNSGTIASQNAVDIRSRRLDNRNGRLLSANKTQLTVSDDLDNRHGEISANRQLSVHDKNQNTLAVNNTDGTIQSAGDVSLQAGTLANGGTLAAGDKLDIALAGDFTVERDIAAGGRLNLTVKGRLKNPRTLQAADTLTLNAGRIDNQVTGRIMAGRQADITSGHDADNRGIINSNGLTRISVGQTLSNTGTGRIYGNHVALSADKLLNREETAQGGTKAGVIAARERLDIGVRKADNRNGALISSEGRLNIGGSLDRGNEASGSAILLTNTGGKIEAGGDAHISAGKLYNLNADFRVEDYTDAQRHLQSFYRNAEALPFFTQDDDGHHRKEDHDLNFDFKDGRHIHIHKYGVEGIWKADYTQTVYKQHIVADRPGEILIGGNLNAQGNWSNQNSRILVGLDLNSDGITNLATLMKVRTVNDGMMRRGSYDRHGSRGSRHIEFDKDVHPVVSPPIRETGFERPVSTVKQHVGNLQPAGKTGMTRPDLSDSLDVKSSTGMVKLPDNSLYTVHPDNKGWLVETDPQFADYRLWLGSDYMLRQLHLDTNHLHKRLGDGYYEQKLVNEQIHRLTGYRRLDGYQSDEEQFKNLMDNGLTAAKTFGLTPGIALSTEQVARLTSDIVWLENQTVILPDGTAQTVLVPKVYALARKGSLNAAGGLISADRASLVRPNGNLTNSGTIAGRQAVLIQAQNIHHSGTLQADRIGLKAEKSINVEGGQVQAGRLLTVQAQNISFGGTTQTSGNKRNGNTIVDRMAQISVTGGHIRREGNGGADGILSLHAGNDINLNAATVSNQVKGGTTRIAAGNNLNLGTIRTEHREAYGALDDKNHRHVRQSAEVGSSIRTQNGALLQAGNDLKIRQGELEAEEGQTVLAAGRDVSISEGRQITELDASFHSKSKGLLSRSQALSRTRLGHDETVGSSIGGGTIAVAAGRDVNVRGSSIISDDGTAIQAGRDISLSAARNRYAGSEYRESKKSGLMGTGGLGFTLGSRKTADDAEHTDLTHTGSTAGSLKGGTAVTAGRRYRQTGSTVSSPEGNNTITAQSIDIEAANNRYAAGHVHTREQKGLTAAINVPVVQAAQNLVQTARTVGQSKNGRVNAMAAANTAWQGYQAARSILQAAGGQNTGISLSLAYGRQKSRSGQTNRRTEAEAGQIIGKGQTTLTAAGGGERSNINITGSDIVGNAATALIADNRITLRSAEQHGSGQDENKSSGWNAGATVRPGSGLGLTAGGNAGKGGGQGKSTAHRHTHVGSTAGKTTIRSGGDTTLKGAQLIGKGVQADTRNLHIESVQDTETYQSKQQNGNVQVTVGYGFSASGSYSQSKVKADHASVTGQSGIYAGEDGYQIKVRDNTDLKGGIITSARTAEGKGKNRFQTATLTHSDIQNHSRYEGRSFGIGGSFDLNGGWDGTVTDKQGRPADRISPAAGYGSDGDGKNSTTRSGINTRNIHIT
ncbi:two-partner secretion domain-containing protein, partial [Neisseria mucosa]|uniref:two-partner secretion domain-containing protein n=1 Tax=Neisseria mucosa TaxID=488 RepID=UPI00280BAC34